MAKELSVFLHEKYAGNVSTKNGQMTFRYASEYNGVPLSMSMPVSTETYSQKYIMPWLDGVISSDYDQRIGLSARYELPTYSPIDILTVMGLECAGAVQFTKAGEEDRINDGSLQLVDNDYIARETIATRMHPEFKKPWAAIGMNWSLSGCQKKGVYTNINGKWFAPFGAAKTTHIIKPGIYRLQNEAFTEVWTTKLAKMCGIVTEDIELSFFNNYPASVITRFDRVKGGKKIHQEDFCQLLHYEIHTKYADQGGPNTIKILEAINKYCDKYKEESIIEFTKQLFYNYLTLSTDSHGQNFSLQIFDDGAKLAPMYDVATFTPYFTDGPHALIRTALSIGGENRNNRLSTSNLKKYAKTAGLSDDFVYDLIMQMINDIPNYADEAYKQTLSNYYRKDDSYYMDFYVPMIEKIEKHCERIKKNLEA